MQLQITPAKIHIDRPRMRPKLTYVTPEVTVECCRRNSAGATKKYLYFKEQNA